MINTNTRRGSTQKNGVGQALPDVTNCQVQPDLRADVPTVNGQKADPRTLRAASSGMTTYVMSGSHPLYKGYSGMTSLCNNGGFTLIELLVVVLIIGILAAVAVPQYQKAVEKSKIVEGLTLLKSVGQAASAYYLTHGTMPTSLDQLDVSLANTGEEIDRKVNSLICGMPDDVRAVSADWGVGLHFNRVFVFRLNGKYAYTETDAKVESSHMRMYVSGVRQGKMTCVVGSSTNDYCQKIIGVHSEGESTCPQLEYQM